MAKESALPFEEGQLVETKSFIPGFRGAWFRCEITEISWKKDRFGHVLYYLDFPDEKKKWMETYQVPPNPDGRSKKKRDRAGSLKKEVKTERQLMLRPAYPPIYHKDQLISTSPSSETKVVIEGGWRVGDLVDWLEDGCYWSGKLTQIIDEEKAMVELLPPPLGEGQSYEASMSRLRPTLDWSLDSGWTVPTPEGVADFHQRVHIMHPEKQTVGDELAAPEESIHCEILREQPVTDGLPGESVRASPHVDGDLEIEHESLLKTKTKSLTNEVIHTPETTMKAPKNAKGMVDTPETTMKAPKNAKAMVDEPETIVKAPKYAKGMVDVPETTVKAPKNAKGMVDVPETTVKAPKNAKGMVDAPETTVKAPKNAEGMVDVPETKMKAPKNAKGMVDTPETTVKAAAKHDNGMVETLETIMKAPEKAEVPLMSDKVDTIEAALMDLEELANRLIWLKQVLKHGYPLPDDASSPSWEFIENRSSSKP